VVFLDRSRRAGPWLEWKVRLFAVAAVLALVGIYLDQQWMTGAAIVVLIGAMVLRFLPGAGGESVEIDDPEGENVDGRWHREVEPDAAEDPDTPEGGRTT